MVGTATQQNMNEAPCGRAGSTSSSTNHPRVDHILVNSYNPPHQIDISTETDSGSGPIFCPLLGVS